MSSEFHEDENSVETVAFSNSGESSPGVDHSNSVVEKNAISRVGVMPLFDVAAMRMSIHLLLFDREREVLQTEQDLEDTLWISAAISEAVAYALENMAEKLTPGAYQACIGPNLLTNLEKAEASMKKIRGLVSPE